MLWFLLALSSTALGSDIVCLAAGRCFPALLHTALSWLVGSFATAIAIFAMNAALPVNALTAALLTCGEFAYCRRLRALQRGRRARPQIDSHPRLFLLCAIAGAVAAAHLRATYAAFPSAVPQTGAHILDTEQSFVASLRHGANRRRAALRYRDPMVRGQRLSGSLPLLLVGAFDALGAKYAEASVLICFANTVCTAVLAYYFAEANTKRPLCAALCLLFNGGWAALRFLFGARCSGADYLHATCARADTPWHQTVGYVLSYSKSASYAVPMLLAVHVLMQAAASQKCAYRRRLRVLAGAIAVCTPSLMGSMSVFAYYACFNESYSGFMPFALAVVPKLLCSRIRFFPVWKESQMSGLFFSPIRVVINSLGPMVIIILLPLLAKSKNESDMVAIIYVSCYILLLLFRCGNDTLDSVVAITGVVLPYFCESFVDTLRLILIRINGKLLKGLVRAIIWFTFVMFIAGGFISIVSMEKSVSKGLDQNDIKCGKWIKRNIPSNDVILSEGFSYDPSVFVAGRQIVAGNFKELWSRGANIFNAYTIIKEAKETKNLRELMERESIHYILCLKSSAMYNKSKLQINETVFQNEKWSIFHLK